MPRSFIVDTDTASDDAVALLMALRHPDVRVEAITVVAGNVELEQGLKNALYTVELSGADVPVYRGSAAPLRRELVVAQFFHGQDGLGDQGYPEAQRDAAEGDAVEVLIEIIRSNPGIVLVTLGPLTNVARALDRAPGIAGQVGRCVVMGGAACTVGNVTPAAEYNVWVDPEAARAVFRSGLPVEMVGWELCRGSATLSEEEMERIRAFGTPVARFAMDCNTSALAAARLQSNEPGLPLPDPVAMAVAIDPSICTRKSLHYVDVETDSDLTRGMTVVDHLDVANDERNAPIWRELVERGRNAQVCWELDIPKWKELLYSVLR
ncbi:MAG: nucleoside hydrolase [Gemmatimonadetes bacterium]|nr:nucleoside hydrolase [Gemmatimonadota bacterium]